MRFMELSEVLDIHRDQINRYGGTIGIRDMELLNSAIAMPAAAFKGELLHTDVYEMAAAYLFHIVKNHPFLDGNKRAGAVTALIFLDLNGYEFHAPDDDLSATVSGVAEGKRNKTDIAVFLRNWSRKL